METRFPHSITLFVPRAATDNSWLSIRAVPTQAHKPKNRPVHAAITAPSALALSQVIKFQRGHTAEPITTPINRYTQPRFSPRAFSANEKQPMKSPKTTITIRDTKRMSSLVACGL